MFPVNADRSAAKITMPGATQNSFSDEFFLVHVSF
jgi:hypothetical protein